MTRKSTHHRRGIVACCQLAVLGALLVSAGCHDLANVSEPNIEQPGAYDTPAGASSRYAAASIHFADGFSNAALGSGLIADEFSDRSGGIHPEDRRVAPDEQNQPSYPYLEFVTARLDALRAIPTLERYAPDSSVAIALSFAMTGYIEMLFAEHLCSGIPLATNVNDVPANATTYDSDALLALAIAHFDSAIVHAQGVDSLSYLGAVGRARAWVDEGEFDSAAAAVRSVPAAFAYYVTADGTSAYNHVAQDTRLYNESSVSDREGGNGLPFVSLRDARVPVDSVGIGVGGAIWAPTNFAAVSSPTVVASGIEASLIRAEAALRDGMTGAWADTLNALRLAFPDTSLSQHPLLADSTTGATSTQRALTMFHERAEWMFGTGHRQGDLRRLVRQYQLPVESVFPTGAYQGGPAQYGTAVTYTPVGDQTLKGYAGCGNRAS